MSMQVQNLLYNCYEGIKDFASHATSWTGKTMSAAGSFVVEGASKVAEYAKDYLSRLKDYVQGNKEGVIIAVVAAVGGALGYALISQVFCRGTNTTPAATTTAAPAQGATAPTTAPQAAPAGAVPATP